MGVRSLVKGQEEVQEALSTLETITHAHLAQWFCKSCKIPRGQGFRFTSETALLRIAI